MNVAARSYSMVAVRIVESAVDSSRSRAAAASRVATSASSASRCASVASRSASTGSAGRAVAAAWAASRARSTSPIRASIPASAAPASGRTVRVSRRSRSASASSAGSRRSASATLAATRSIASSRLGRAGDALEPLARRDRDGRTVVARHGGARDRDRRPRPGQPLLDLLDVARHRAPRGLGVAVEAGQRLARRRQPVLDVLDPTGQLDERRRCVAFEVAQPADVGRLRIEPVERPGRALDDLAEHRIAGGLVLGHIVVELLAERERGRQLALGIGDGAAQLPDGVGTVLRLGEVDLLARVADALVGRDEQRVGALAQLGPGQLGGLCDGGAGRRSRRVATPPPPVQQPAADGQEQQRGDRPQDAAAIAPARRRGRLDRSRDDRRLGRRGRPGGEPERLDRGDRSVGLVRHRAGQVRACRPGSHPAHRR